MIFLVKIIVAIEGAGQSILANKQFATSAQTKSQIMQQTKKCIQFLLQLINAENFAKNIVKTDFKRRFFEALKK